jgi:hypothetical protein
MVIEVVDSQDNAYKFNTSSASLMEEVWARWERDELPFRAKIVEQQTKSGRTCHVWE